MHKNVTPTAWTPPHRRLILLVCCLLLAANVFDACTTLMVTSIFGLQKELIPFVRIMIAIGPGWFIAIKTVAILWVAVSLGRRARLARFPWYCLCIATSYYVLTCIFQAIQLALVWSQLY